MTRSPTHDSSDPLRAFLWGKRQSCRYSMALDVAVRGALSSFTALSIDLSATGVLLRVPVDQLQPESAGSHEVDPFTLAETHFRGACLANFKRRRVKVHLELVRLDFRPDEPGFLFLGFRFARPLDAKQLKRFGLSPDSTRAEEHGRPAEMLSLRANGDPVACRIFNNGDSSRPMFEGRVLGVGPKSLCVRLSDGDVGLVAKRLRGAKVRVEVMDGGQPMWDSPALLQAIGFESGASSDLELGFVLHKNPTRRVRKQLGQAGIA